MLTPEAGASTIDAVKVGTESITTDIALYLEKKRWMSPTSVEFLAAGEYNENYLVSDGKRRLVFRINHDSQLNLDRQIEYEYNVLTCLADSGVTPKPIDVDTDAPFGRGVLLMEYLPGGPFDYPRDSLKAARVFALIHTTPPSPMLITQLDPIESIISESERLVRRFPDHPLTDQKKAILEYRDVLRSRFARNPLRYDGEDLTITNTEVNSGNFIVDGDSAYLVDWEKAVNSFRYQDLGHFLVPTTTLWKTDFSFGDRDRHAFLDAYSKHACFDISQEEFIQRTNDMEAVILLRALSWCYMAHYEYSNQDRSIRNLDTFRRIQWYMDSIPWFLN